MALSDRISRTKNLLAVIGHEWTDTAVTASSIYSRNKIMFMATQATATSLTNHNFKTVFAMQPDNATNAYVIADYALSQGIKRVIVLADKSDYAKESANFFTEAVTKAGANVVYRGYLSGAERSTDDLVMFILDNPLFSQTDFDAFFIVSSSTNDTAEFIKRARYLGLTVPILGMETMFSAAVEKQVGKKGMKDTVGVSLYDRDNITDRGQAFVKDYQERFKHLPDLNSALGYDAVILLRDAIERVQTLDPGRISDILKVARYKSPFTGVTGALVFDRNGLITDTNIFIVRHNGDEFHTVAWRGGKQFPAGTAETIQLLDDGQIDLAITFNPNAVYSAQANGNLAKSTTAYAMNQGALSNIHFLAIPWNANAKAGAQVAINFLLSPDAQSRKGDLNVWGDPSVLSGEYLTGSAKNTQQFKSIAEPHPSWQSALEKEWLKRYGN